MGRRELLEFVRKRAGFRCEFCHFPESSAGLNFQFDHVIAEKHGGRTTSDNLALSCIYCNSYKGPNLSGIDSITNRVVSLFNPRRDYWGDHFRWHDALLAGRTPIGRATIDVLRINEPTAVALRKILIRSGAFPLE